jgi:putative ABC transport system permease protein
VLTTRVRLPDAKYPAPESQHRFFETLMARLQREPSISTASAASSLPLGQYRFERDVVTALMKDPTKERITTNYCDLLPGALETIGVPLVRGRMFTASDDEKAPKVALLSRSLAKRLFPGGDAVGQRLRFGGEPESLGWQTIVGVVGDVVHFVDLGNGSDPLDAVYQPIYQRPASRVSLLVHTRGNTDAATLAMRAALRAVDPDLVAEDLRTLREEFRFRLWQRRLFASLLGVCAILAFVIAAVGLYGVMAYSVAQRTREIGIRMALGAQATTVQRMVVRQALRLTLTGIVIGLAAAFALTRFMTNVILGVSPTDPPTFFAVTLMLALSGLLAAWVPAYRAVRVDPVVALRHE